MAQVYDLWFEREYADREDTELHIGIYEAESDAVRLQGLCPFFNSPDRLTRVLPHPTPS